MEKEEENLSLTLNDIKSLVSSAKVPLDYTLLHSRLSKIEDDVRQIRFYIMRILERLPENKGN